MFEEAPSEMPAGENKKTERLKRRNATRALYKMLRWYSQKKGGEEMGGGELTVVFPKVEDGVIT